MARSGNAGGVNFVRGPIEIIGDSADEDILTISNRAGTEVLKIQGRTPGQYTPSNVTESRTFDADTVDVAGLADVVGTLIADLQALKLIG